MPFATSNAADATDISLVAVLGLRMYFRDRPAAVDAAFHDFGYVRSPAREQDLTELEIQSARLGRLSTIKKITTGQTLEYTFESISVFDQATLGYHSGGAVGTADGTSAAAGEAYAVEDFVGTEGQMLLVQENAESGGIIKVAFYPKVTIIGDGEESGDGETESTLSFRSTVLENENYVIPAGLVVGTPSAPFGFRYLAASANLDAVLDAIAGQASV